MTSRQILHKNIKDLLPLLESVEKHIQMIKDIKDSLPELDEHLKAKEIETERQLERMERNLREKKLETITTVATELGKIIISPVDMEDLVNEIKDVRNSVTMQVQEKTDVAVDKFKTNIIHEVRIKDLLHEKELAVLDIKMKMKDDEIQSLKDKYELLQNQVHPHSHSRGLQTGRPPLPSTISNNQPI